jgi:hypothetical protein
MRCWLRGFGRRWRFDTNNVLFPIGIPAPLLRESWIAFNPT